MIYIGVDLGLKRIGVAMSDGIVVVPLSAIERKNRNQAANELKELLLKYNADILVMGLPMGSDSEAEMRRRIEHFLSLVKFDGEVVYQDESFSSQEAEEMMRGEIKYVRDGRIDSLSAKIILERYLKTI